MCVSVVSLQPVLDVGAEQRMGGGSTVCVSKLTTHLLLFVAPALLNFPEIHIFTTAEGINNYQSALIHCSA